MVRLTIVTGFLAVFGIAAYVAILLLKDYFKSKDRRNKTT